MIFSTSMKFSYCDADAAALAGAGEEDLNVLEVDKTNKSREIDDEKQAQLAKNAMKGTAAGGRVEVDPKTKHTNSKTPGASSGHMMHPVYLCSRTAAHYIKQKKKKEETSTSPAT